MSVNPLDLQVIFAQMNQVGKQQSLLKESQLLRQDHASQNVIKDGEKEAEEVPQSKDLSEGPDKVKDHQEKRKSSQEEEEEEKKKDEEENGIKADFEKEDDVKDPLLGQNIDLMG